METPEFYQGVYYNTQFAPEKQTGDHFIVEDLLDFPNDDPLVNDGNFENVAGTSTDDSSAVAPVDSCNTSFSGGEALFPGDNGCRSLADAQFSSDLCVPYDELAELEWLSNFVEESFSTEEFQKLQLISGVKARPDESPETREFQSEMNRKPPMFRPEGSVPGKARSKRSRAAPGNWTSRLLVLSPNATPTTSSDSDTKKAVKAALKKKESGADSLAAENGGGDGRRCLHCATDKTPQWRTGPMGPKTLCNACGVRFKSGRLVPEYRPAASPTFMLTKHSNSHRKVLELRRQKEAQRAQQQQQQFLHQNMMFDVTNGDDYLIHQHIGPDFRHLI